MTLGHRHHKKRPSTFGAGGFYHILPYFTIFYHILPYFTIFYHILPYFTIFYHILPYFTIFYNYHHLSSMKLSLDCTSSIPTGSEGLHQWSGSSFHGGGVEIGAKLVLRGEARDFFIKMVVGDIFGIFCGFSLIFSDPNDLSNCPKLGHLKILKQQTWGFLQPKRGILLSRKTMKNQDMAYGHSIHLQCAWIIFLGTMRFPQLMKELIRNHDKKEVLPPGGSSIHHLIIAMVSDDPSWGNQAIPSDVLGWLHDHVRNQPRWKNTNAVAWKMLPVWRGGWSWAWAVHLSDTPVL